MTTPNAPGQAPVSKPAATDNKPTAQAKEPAKKAAKPKKDPTTPPRPRLPKHPDEHVITVLKPNSKARGAADRFLQYKTGMTVKAYVDVIREMFQRTDGQTHADIRWDEDHKFIHVGPTVVPVPAEPAKPAAPAQPAA